MGSAKSHRSQTSQAMHHNRRMVRTLGCLVASMTMGAALLDWAQPPGRAPVTTARTELMSVLRRGTTPGNWRAIQLDPQASDREGPPSHFKIDAACQAVSTNLWQDQEPAGSDGIVRIALLVSDNSNQVSPEQWAKAQELVRLLQEDWPIPDEQVHKDMLAVSSDPAPAPSRRGSAPPSRTNRRP